MVTSQDLKDDFQQVIDETGFPVRFRYFEVTYVDDGYDNVSGLKNPTDVWTSGIKQPINNRDLYGSSQEFHNEQGLLKSDDSKLYVLADVNISGEMKIGIGSPIQNEYGIIEGGARTWNAQGDEVYHKLYIRRLTNGSLIGE